MPPPPLEAASTWIRGVLVASSDDARRARTTLLTGLGAGQWTKPSESLAEAASRLGYRTTFYGRRSDFDPETLRGFDEVRPLGSRRGARSHLDSLGEPSQLVWVHEPTLDRRREDRMARLERLAVRLKAYVDAVERSGQLARTTLVLTSDRGSLESEQDPSSPSLLPRETLEVPFQIALPSAPDEVADRGGRWGAQALFASMLEVVGAPSAPGVGPSIWHPSASRPAFSSRRDGTVESLVRGARQWVWAAEGEAEARVWHSDGSVSSGEFGAEAARLRARRQLWGGQGPRVSELGDVHAPPSSPR